VTNTIIFDLRKKKRESKGEGKQKTGNRTERQRGDQGEREQLDLEKSV
jgi:hypothetical protein